MTFEDRVTTQRIGIMEDWVAKTASEIRSLEQQLTQVKPKGEYYLQMQRHILASSSAMEAWQTFMVIVQLAVADKIPGITH